MINYDVNEFPRLSLSLSLTFVFGNYALGKISCPFCTLK